MDEITDHDRKDQIQSGHGKRPYDHPDQNVHVGTVIFHKFSYHSILLVFNKKQFVLYYNAKGMWLQGERRPPAVSPLMVSENSALSPLTSPYFPVTFPDPRYAADRLQVDLLQP